MLPVDSQAEKRRSSVAGTAGRAATRARMRRAGSNTTSDRVCARRDATDAVASAARRQRRDAAGAARRRCGAGSVWQKVLATALTACARKAPTLTPRCSRVHFLPMTFHVKWRPPGASCGCISAIFRSNSSTTTSSSQDLSLAVASESSPASSQTPLTAAAAAASSSAGWRTTGARETPCKWSNHHGRWPRSCVSNSRRSERRASFGSAAGFALGSVARTVRTQR